MDKNLVELSTHLDDVLKLNNKAETMELVLSKFNHADIIEYCAKKYNILNYVTNNYNFTKLAEELNASMHDILDYALEEYDEKAIMNYIQSSNQK